MITIIVAVAVTVAVIFIINVKVHKRINDRGGCPNCGTPVPMFRRPTSFKQSLWGGWTCAECRTELDRYGAELSQS